MYRIKTNANGDDTINIDAETFDILKTTGCTHFNLKTEEVIIKTENGDVVEDDVGMKNTLSTKGTFIFKRHDEQSSFSTRQHSSCATAEASETIPEKVNAGLIKDGETKTDTEEKSQEEEVTQRPDERSLSSTRHDSKASETIPEKVDAALIKDGETKSDTEEKSHEEGVTEGILQMDRVEEDWIDCESTKAEPPNPHKVTGPENQAILNKLWSEFWKHTTKLQNKLKDAHEMKSECSSDLNTLRCIELISLLLNVQIANIKCAFENYLKKTELTVEDISSFENLWNETENYIEESLEQIQQPVDLNSRMYKKTQDIQTKLKKTFDEKIFKLFDLQQIVNDMGSPEAKYSDSEELNTKLTEFTEKLNHAKCTFVDAFDQSSLVIALSEDLCFQCDELDNFRTSTVEQLTASLNTLEVELEQIKEHYKFTPEGQLSRTIKQLAISLGLQLKNKDNLEIIKLPLQETHNIPSQKLRRFELGEPRPEKDHRYILLTGMTGSGKSLLVNNMINYIYGVNHKDNFRFKLVVESEEIAERGAGAEVSQSEANSMTSWVTSFTLNWQEGFRVSYSLTIVDTPGFGDTRGLEYDEEIIGQIREFFNNGRVCPTHELSCIGLLIQASAARITEEQKYIFDQVLNLFGKDMTDNIFLVFTFADAQPPPALAVVKENKIPYAKGCEFKFNNSAVYAPNDTKESKYSWEFGYDSLEKYFAKLAIVEPVSLVLTKQVLDKREKLRLILGTLHAKISNGMDTLKEIEDQSKFVLTLDGAISANRNFKVKKQSHKCEMKIVPHAITNCNSCNFTCHSPCGIPNDNKRGCAAIRGDNCVACPSKCHYDKHTNGTKIYVYTPIEVEETVEEMLKSYNVAVDAKNAKKKVLKCMLAKYQKQKEEVFESIKKANEYSNELEKIALRNSFLNNVEYIKRLIQAEERSSRPNKTHRLQQMRHMQDMAEILRDAKENPEALTGRVSEYEAKIAAIIDSIQDEETDDTADKDGKPSKKGIIDNFCSGVKKLNPFSSKK